MIVKCSECDAEKEAERDEVSLVDGWGCFSLWNEEKSAHVQMFYCPEHNFMLGMKR
jgi:hypothetical protein